MIAVFSPKGPLRMLLDAAAESDQPITALVFSSSWVALLNIRIYYIRYEMYFILRY